MNRAIKILVFLFPIVAFFFFLSVKLLSPDTYSLWIQEDSVVEYAQALFYFTSSILSFLVSIKFLKNKLAVHGVLYGILAFILLFIFAEEISWGQRIFNIETFDYFQRNNYQQDMSIHNLKIIQIPVLIKTYMLVGAYGAFAWILVRLFAPEAKANFTHIINYIVPDWFISSYFFFVFFVYTLLLFIWMNPPGFLLSRDQEPAELLLSMGFLWFVTNNYVKLNTYLKNTSGRVP
jgi:hypothetical protein